MTLSNPLPSGSVQSTHQLTGEVSIHAADAGKSTVSQKAIINGKSVTITLEFDQGITKEQATSAMKASLAKVAELATAFKLGEVNPEGETTKSLILHDDKSLTRNFTKQTATEDAATAPIQVRKYNEAEVSAILRATTQKVATTGAQALTSPNLPVTPRSIAISEERSLEDLEELEVESDTFHSTLEFPLEGNEVEGSQEILQAAQIGNNPLGAPVLSAESTSKGIVGKEFSDEFKMGKQVIAREEAVREDTVPALIQGLATKIDKLGAKLEELKAAEPRDEAKIAKLQKQVDKAVADLEKYAKNVGDATWASTNSPRFAFLKLGREGAKNELAPVVCNLRMQKVMDADGNVVSAVSRSGAISDFSHGEVSLQELKDLEDLQKIADGKELPKDRLDHLKGLYLQDIKDSFNERLDVKAQAVIFEIKVKALVGYGAEALAQKPELEGLKPILTKLESCTHFEEMVDMLSDEERVLLIDTKLDPGKVNEVIGQRSERLKLMALQDLELHMRTTKADKDPILYGRTSLVDLKKPANNEAGCILYERTQGLDMKALFEELDGATVVFDEDIAAAYIDDEGQIHMPKDCAAEGVESTTLNTVFFNICVQGFEDHLLNDGMQKAINDKTLDKLRQQYGKTPEFKALEMSLQKLEKSDGYDPNEAVVMVTQFIQKNGGYSGLNCYGGKDRTGYAIALITHAHLAKLAGISLFAAAAKKWGHQLLRNGGVAARIAKDNADHTTLKLLRKDLLLYNTNSIKGKMLRAAHFCDGAGMAIMKKIKLFFKLSPLTQSSTPGQLYRVTSSQVSSEKKAAESFKQIKGREEDEESLLGNGSDSDLSS